MEELFFFPRYSLTCHFPIGENNRLVCQETVVLGLQFLNPLALTKIEKALL